MSLSTSCQKVQNYLNRFNLKLDVQELAKSTRTAQQAADAVGCGVGQIVKSLIFRTGDQPLLFLVSGKNQLDVDKVNTAFNFQLQKADARFVREKSGYAIGGVPPVAHAFPMEVFIDRDLMEYDELWAAAGTPNAVFRLRSNDLPRITGGKVIDIK